MVNKQVTGRPPDFPHCPGARMPGLPQPNGRICTNGHTCPFTHTLPHTLTICLKTCTSIPLLLHLHLHLVQVGRRHAPRLCRNGHSCCGTCARRLGSRCPTCRYLLLMLLILLLLLHILQLSLNLLLLLQEPDLLDSVPVSGEARHLPAGRGQDPGAGGGGAAGGGGGAGLLLR